VPNFNANTVESEIRMCFDRYEAALTGNVVAALTEFFWRDDRVVRLSSEGSLYGFDAIANFRRGRAATDMARELLRVDVVALSPDLGVATAEYRRTGSGRRGLQSQVWMRTADGWRIASAHVSIEPLA